MGRIKGRLKSRTQETSKSIGVPNPPKEQDIDNSPPVFSLRYLQRDFCIERCEKNERAAFAVKLFKLSQLTWADIRQADRHGLGTEKISRDSIKAAIPEHITPDVDFLAFRFNGKAPMVGYKLGSIFYILWLDRSFKLYEH
ncbi:hypothetical protein [Serratia marcescens]|uniref:hypothetical protein n=1 Tax=Serratia marcescens TaxID=615 RepID=UPI00090050F9|nr:hypothetical protein [Serratia marcescens]